MIGTPGPFRIIKDGDSGCVDGPIPPPRRRYLCPNYSLCLDLAGALNWDNFTCRGCSSEVDQSMLWRARQAVRKDKELSKLFTFPEVKTYVSEVAKNDDPKDKENPTVAKQAGKA